MCSKVYEMELPKTKYINIQVEGKRNFQKSQMDLMKIKLMDLPLEVRAGIFKNVSSFTVSMLRLASTQIKEEVDSFYNYSVYLHENNPQQRQFRLKDCIVQKLLKPVGENSLHFLKYPQALNSLEIDLFLITPQNCAILTKESGQYLKKLKIILRPPHFDESHQWTSISSFQTAFPTYSFKNLQRLEVLDVPLLEFTYNETEHQKILYFLELASFSNLKSVKFTLRRSHINVNDVLEFSKKLLTIISQKSLTLKEVSITFYVTEFVQLPELQKDFRTLQSDCKKLKNLGNLKKLSLECFSWAETNSYEAMGALESLIFKQNRLEHLQIKSIHSFVYENFLEIVSRNLETLRTIDVDIYSKDGTHELYDLLPLQSLKTLEKLLWRPFGCNSSQEVEFDVPISLEGMDSDGFQLGTMGTQSYFYT